MLSYLRAGGIRCFSRQSNLDSDAIPKDPWGNDYLYVCPGTHNPASYDLMSMGVDARADTDDDICNWTKRK